MDELLKQMSNKWVLFWFQHFLSIPDDDLKFWIDIYNGGLREHFMFDEARIALEAIEEMSG